MDYNELKNLLDKYWKCETTLEEESRIRKLFENENIPEDLEPYAPLFRYFNNISDVKPVTDFNSEDPGKIPGDTVKIRREPGNRIQWLYRAAAVILLIISVIVVHEQIITVKRKAIEITKDTYSNPKEALQETKKMLMLISVKMNKGEAQAIKLSEFHEAENMIRKQIK
jgi:hypothetical protein